MERILNVINKLLATLLATLALVCTAFAQPRINVTGPATVQPGQSLVLTVSMSQSLGQIHAVEWNMSSAFGTFSSPVETPEALAAGKHSYCGAGANSLLCIVVGWDGVALVGNNNVLPDGPMVRVNWNIPVGTPTGPLTVKLDTLFAANTATESVIPVAGPTYTVVVGSKCDVNGDGTVDGTDIGIVINGALGKSQCTASFGCNLLTVVQLIGAVLPGGSCPF